MFSSRRRFEKPFSNPFACVVSHQSFLPSFPNNIPTVVFVHSHIIPTCMIWAHAHRCKPSSRLLCFLGDPNNTQAQYRDAQRSRCNTVLVFCAARSKSSASPSVVSQPLFFFSAFLHPKHRRKILGLPRFLFCAEVCQS